jgi:glycosyltransferase involved in cell wall biosynthesis
MRVAELTTYTSRLNGGVFYALTGMLPRMAVPAGDEIRVFGYLDAHTEDDRDDWKPLKVEAFRPWPPRHFGFSPQFLPALRQYQPDLIHSHGIWTYLSAASLRVHRNNRIPMIISPHGMLDAWALGYSRLRKRLVGHLFQDAQLKSAAVLHALTAAEARSIRAYGLKNPIVVIPNGVDLPRGTPGVAPWPPSSGSRDRTLLFLSRVHPKKGLDVLLDAWAGFSRADGPGRNWRLIVAGWDEIGHEKVLRERVSTSELRTSVEFVGPLFGAKKAAAFAGADAFVLPSYSEGLPMSVLEAWSHGKPALISTACNLPEGKHSGASIEIEPTSESISAGLGRLASMSREDLKTMGQAGRRLVESRFNWDRVSSDMAKVYLAIVDGKPLPQKLLYQN